MKLLKNLIEFGILVDTFDANFVVEEVEDGSEKERNDTWGILKYYRSSHINYDDINISFMMKMIKFILVFG